MKRLLFLGTLLVSVLSVMAEPAPMLIPFQGRLTDQQARPYTSGQYTITFVLYDQAVGGSPLWTETHERVGVINGMVNVFLGSIRSLSGVNFSETRHLGITIDADNNQNTPDPEMVPRQMIIPSFWSKYADNSAKLAGNDWSAILVSGATNPATGRIDGAKLGDRTVTHTQIGDHEVTSIKLSDDAVRTNHLAAGSVVTSKIADGAVTAEKIAPAVQFVPPGTIVAFGGAVVPSGWKLCDGTLVPRSGEFAALFEAIGTAWGSESANDFRLPDLQGYFLRGRDNNAGTDPDRSGRVRLRPNGNIGDNVGSYQSDQWKTHKHLFGSEGGVSYERYRANYTNPRHGGDGGWGDGFTGNNPSDPGGNETRPKNAYVNYIIKF